MKLFLSVFAAVVSLSTFCHAQQPTAEQIIGGAKMSAILQQADLSGTMSNSKTKVNIALFLRNTDIQFQYWEGKDWKKFHMQMNDDKCRLLEMVNGKQQDFPVSRIAQPIAGADLTFEDLAMRFFYWKKPILEGQERVGTHNCWKIRLNNPGVGGAYQVMYVWVHQKYGAFMKIEGFNREGKILKRFEVTDVMSIKSATGASVYTLKQMNVSTLNPSNGRSVSLTKLIFEEPKMLAPKGPR